METESFTVRDGLAWLGITWETYEQSAKILAGRHGNPIGSALLDARSAQGTDIAPDEVLARHGIDPSDPPAAVRSYNKRQERYDA